MATFRQRLPSAQDTARVFAACVVPLYSWSILAFLSRVRAWLYHMPVWDVIGIAAYSLVFAALESGAILLVLLLLGAALPEGVLKDRFVVRGSSLVGLGLGAALVAQSTMAMPLVLLAREFPRAYALCMAPLVLGLIVCCVLVWRTERLAKVVASVVERLVLLMNLYVLATCVAVVILIIRNL